MLKQTKIITSLITMALIATQLQAGFLNFDGEYGIRVQTDKYGSNDSSVMIGNELELSGSKRLQDGFTVNYGIATGEIRTDEETGEIITNRRSKTAESIINKGFSLNLRELNLSYAPVDGLTITAGRQESALTAYSSIVADKDLTYDAVTVEYDKTVGNGINLGAKFMYSTLETSFVSVAGDNTKTEGENLIGFEVNADYDINADVSVGGYVTMLQTNNRPVVAERAAAAEDDPATPDVDETVAAIGKDDLQNTVFGLNVDYNTTAVGTVTGYVEMNKNNNSAFDKAPEALAYGVVVGDKNVQGLGSWKVGLELRETDINSTVDILEDNYYTIWDNELNSTTFVAEAGISAKSSFKFRYIDSESVAGETKTDLETMTFEIITKF